MNENETKENMLEAGHDGAGKEGQSSRKKSLQNSTNPVIKFLKNPENLLVTLTVFSVISSMIVAFIIKFTTDVSPRGIQMISFPGELLMNMLKMLIIPLIVSSLIAGLAALDPRSSGKMGSWALAYYFSTTMFAVILGIILVVIIHPGSSKVKENLGSGTMSKGSVKVPDTLDAFMDLFRNIFPPNIIQACMEQQQSNYKEISVQPKFKPLQNSTNASTFFNVTTYEKLTTEFTSSTNVLGIVTFSIAFGMILGQMGEKAKPMLEFFIIMNEVVMRLVGIIMWYSPIGIFFLIMGKILEIDDLSQTAAALGLYMLTVILGLVIHTCLTLSLMFFIITRKNPFTYFRGVFQAWITALGTASSAATLPITFRCLEENNKIDKRVTRFVLPIGATINMDGTALYEAVATIFIAQINGVALNVGQIITISLTATLAAIGAASVPSAGLVTMILVLTSVGLPINDVTLIFAVDWLLDRLRTSINVLGDAFGAGIVHHLCRDELAKQDAEMEAKMAALGAEEGVDFGGEHGKQDTRM